MKVKIYTFADKAPDFIGWQAELFKRFLKDDYEFIVMNNSSSSRLDIQIRKECSNSDIHIEKVLKKDFNTGCFACAVPIQWTIDNFIGKDDDNISVIIDSDLFLMKEFSFTSFMEGWDIAGVPQSRDTGYDIIEYLWNVLVVIHPKAPSKSTIHMGCGAILHSPVDVGGLSYFYLRSNPEIRWMRINTTGIIPDHPEVLGMFPDNIRPDYKTDYQMEIINNEWLHFRGGSRWDNRPKEFYEEKEGFIKKLVYGK
jgi:hypothetical protein